MTSSSVSQAGRNRHAGPTWTEALVAETRKVVVGQERVVHRLLVGLLAGGHVLLEGVPGLAKTTLVRTLAQACHLAFQRIQFTPDLLPADLIGTLVYHPKTMEFAVHRGPIFASLVLADEINRAPAKVQSALLEAMEERAVTIGRETYPLGDPFMVLATQNPIEQDGTFPLPEAQLDRFLFHVRMSYPPRSVEMEMLARHLSPSTPQVQPVVGASDLLQARHSLMGVFVDAAILSYVLDLVEATRAPSGKALSDLAPLLRVGASPRAAVHLTLASRAAALLAGRTYVLPEDVQAMAPDVLRHRLVLSYDAQADRVDPEHLVRRVLDAVPVP